MMKSPEKILPRVLIPAALVELPYRVAAEKANPNAIPFSEYDLSKRFPSIENLPFKMPPRG